MNDEAVCHYSSIIENFSWGLRKLNDTFSGCGRPKVGWQVSSQLLSPQKTHEKTLTY